MGERPPMIMETPMGTRRIARARSGLRRSLQAMLRRPCGSGYGAARSLAAVSTRQVGRPQTPPRPGGQGSHPRIPSYPVIRRILVVLGFEWVATTGRRASREGPERRHKGPASPRLGLFVAKSKDRDQRLHGVHFLGGLSLAASRAALRLRVPSLDSSRSWKARGSLLMRDRISSMKRLLAASTEPSDFPGSFMSL